MNSYSQDDFKRWLSTGGNDEFSSRATERDTTNWLQFLMTSLKKHNKEKDKLSKLNEYFVTFAFPPGSTEDDTNQRSAEVSNMIYRFSQSSQIGAQEFWVTMEHTQIGTPHYHCFLRTQETLKRDFFRTYLKKYPSEKSLDISKVTKNTSERVQLYMSKENIPINILKKV